MLKCCITLALKALCSVKEEELGAVRMKVEFKMSLHLLKGLYSL